MSDNTLLSPDVQQFMSDVAEEETQLHPDIPVVQPEQTTPSGCSLGEVKDEVSPASPAPADIFRPIPTDFDGIDIASPLELLLLVDNDIQSGKTKLHKWQIQFMLDFSNDSHTKDSPFQAIVQACNGSGKDKYIIAACAVWLCMRYREAQCPITSSSGDQLDKQTGAHVDRLCNQVNAVFGPLWKIQYRYYECKHFDGARPASSIINMFATDEAGKAEGYHPIEAGKRMAIFTSETKSIPEDITNAIERCTGFTHRVDASSPGLPSGYFFNTASMALNRWEIPDIKALDSTQFLLYKVTAADCSHITESEIKRFISKMPGGVNNPVVKSSIFAEFGTTDEMVVVPSSFVWKAANGNIDWIKEPYNTGGLDLSDGGAETVLIVRNGNKVLHIIPFKFENTEDTIDFLQEKFKEHNLNSPEALVFADCCGMGKPMLNSLRRKGWTNIRYVDSRHKASEYRTYANRGTELFFHMRELMQGAEIIIPRDTTLIAQLSTRYYKITTNNIHQLLSKLEQRSRGYPSPDRADALNLAFWNYKSTRVEEEDAAPFKSPDLEQEAKNSIVPSFDMVAWANNKSPSYQIDHVENDFSEIREALSEYNKTRTASQTPTQKITYGNRNLQSAR